ncbi:uncharacterized protein LOC129096874 isoform X2 [Anoplopoma fimbria]|uniref:uncharacterized protein LOC129096874 isoform X2 n=1 Tax=Anoplopoma fimbria TaxID=229290 RepID=UPI0023EAC9F8|nr:uncharacterized protein LOC129096874 isoform X2 [Anoplopoma fimbria]
MSKAQILRSLVNQRLTAAAEEIFELFERTIAEHEEELSRSKEENERQRKLLDAVFNPEVRIQRADAQQLLVVKEEVPPEQQEWSSSLDQRGPEPSHIKEEQEELWTRREGEQLQGLEEADIKFSFTPVKSDDGDKEDVQSSQLHQRQIEENREEEHLQPAADGTSHYFEPDTDDSGDWEDTREPQSDLNPQKNNEIPAIHWSGEKERTTLHPRD